MIIMIIVMIIMIIIVIFGSYFTVPQKGYAKRGCNRQVTQQTLLSHF